MTNNRCHILIRITLIAALLLMLPLFRQTALAEICWGKVCSGSICCSGHGTCESFNNCVCDEGYTGKECGTPTFCGSLSCDTSCGGHGGCSIKTIPSFTGTCTPPGGGLSLTCTADSVDSRYAICTGAGLPSAGGYKTCTLNGASGICKYDTSTQCRWSYEYSYFGEDSRCSCEDGYTGACCTFGATLAPAALDFGNVSVGATGYASTPVTFTNPMAASALTLGTITLDGANSADFSLGSGTCAAAGSVAAAGTCTVLVNFVPTATGTRSATLTVTTASPAVTLTTSLIGTGTISADSIVVDPVTTTTLYAGLNGAGIYKSTDSGATWTAATTQPVNRRIKAVAIDKNDSTKLYAAAYGGGVFKSTDSGVTWSACATSPANLNLVSLIINASGKLYAGTEAGVFVSADGCGIWTPINGGLP